MNLFRLGRCQSVSEVFPATVRLTFSRELDQVSSYILPCLPLSLMYRSQAL